MPNPIERALERANKINTNIPKPKYRLMAGHDDYKWSLIGAYSSDQANDMIWTMLGKESYAPDGNKYVVNVMYETDEVGNVKAIYRHSSFQG